ESGSPAWQAGIRSGMVITRIDDNKHPTFEDLRIATGLSNKNEEISLVLKPHTGKGPALDVQIEPRRDRNDVAPVIGVAPPHRLVLLPPELEKVLKSPVAPDSAASSARSLPLKPGDLVVAATEPGKTGLTSLPSERAAQFQELSRRLVALQGQPL